MFGLLQWHLWEAPTWLLRLTWNLERVVARYFSAALLLRTLVSHWHKDAVSYSQGSISGIALAFAWNMISRAIGFVIRTILLTLYVAIAGVLAVVGLAATALFLIWPALALASILYGIS